MNVESSKESTEEKPTATDDEQLTLQNEDSEQSKEVYVDLTQMGSDLVYATIFQMMMEPNSYQGKKIRITGNYNVS